MTRLEALEAVAKAARRILNENLGSALKGWRSLDGAICALDALPPPQPPGKTVEVWLDEHDGEVTFCRPRSKTSVWARACEMVLVGKLTVTVEPQE
jgi:hypothetical protein